jgi:PAS domain S-box-containing protein
VTYGVVIEADVPGVSREASGIQEANDAFLGIVGYTRQDLEAGRIAWDVITPPEWAHADDEAVEQMGLTGAFRPYEKEYLHRDGHRVPVLMGAALLDRDRERRMHPHHPPGTHREPPAARQVTSRPSRAGCAARK